MQDERERSATTAEVDGDGAAVTELERLQGSRRRCRRFRSPRVDSFVKANDENEAELLRASTTIGEVDGDSTATMELGRMRGRWSTLLGEQP